VETGPYHIFSVSWEDVVTWLFCKLNVFSSASIVWPGNLFLRNLIFFWICKVSSYWTLFNDIWQIKELREDIVVPDYCYAGGGELQSLNAWFGPDGTVTPLHHDPHHNLFAQVSQEYSSVVVILSNADAW
jgi:hypothetical protein